MPFHCHYTPLYSTTRHYFHLDRGSGSGSGIGIGTWANQGIFEISDEFGDFAALFGSFPRLFREFCALTAATVSAILFFRIECGSFDLSLTKMRNNMRSNLGYRSCASAQCVIKNSAMIMVCAPSNVKQQAPCLPCFVFFGFGFGFFVELGKRLEWRT